MYETSTSITRYLNGKLLFCALYLLVFGSIYIVQPPQAFPTPATVSISRGSGLSGIAYQLEAAHLIRSKFLFKVFAVILGQHKGLQAGDYYFEKPMSLFEVAFRIETGYQNIALERITIPEGSNVREIAQIIKKQLPKFDAVGFITQALKREGMLFPDTYLFYANVTPEQVIKTMNDTFVEKMRPLESQIRASGKSLNDIIKMASILEEEAKTQKDWDLVAGILWKRLDAKMPLQVDASLKYYNGKTSAQLTKADLTEKNVYNTYTNLGLPPTAISNPGLQTIQAALKPVSSPYWYYLSDKKDIVHYARTLEEHGDNRQKYL